MSLIQQRLRELTPSDLLTLWILDLTTRGGTYLYFYNPKDPAAAGIDFQGNHYTPFPIKDEGQAVTSKGASPRPTVTVGNVNSAITSLTLQYGDLVGCKVIRKQTLFEFTDGQPGADPTQELTIRSFRVERKLNENNVFCQFQLVAPWDVEKLTLPRRKLLSNSCAFQYRGPECAFAGHAKANADESVFYGLSFTDGVTHSTDIMESATANFTSADLARLIVGSAFATGTGIVKIISPTQIQLTRAALNTGTGRTFQVVGRTVQRGVYNPATTYAAQDEVYTLTTDGIHLVWVSLVNGNLGNPLTDPTKWGPDICGKRIFSCKCRFGPANPLRTSAMPGIDKLAAL